MNTRAFLFCALILFLASCGVNFAPIIDKGNKYYGRGEAQKSTDEIDDILDSIS